MPIDIERFERESEFGGGETHAERVLAFLAENDDRAFQRGEIAEATGIDPNAVSSVLYRLKERELVRHKRPYWAVGGRERLAAANALSRSIDAFDDRLGVEDMDEWRAAADERDGTDERDEASADREGEPGGTE